MSKVLRGAAALALVAAVGGGTAGLLGGGSDHASSGAVSALSRSWSK
ncbi:hypothetical protein EV189_2721 [Motilibacter rhizosphaerae]|uniref:Uncharacterized protein n=1 Tax=Motilibacter rhizosphaerae TaxID=598652 RepID=A0A4Q7NQK7_9ACTN|nr:hypothetical protein [Motilibacter rhizosphaerae]RZS87296.1 hypothetical protein EV189_2721 [Motilibacter rhizosphaerae]